MRTSFLGALASVAILAAPLGAAAQQPPPQQPPSYAQPATPSYATQDEQIHGRIASFDGRYDLQVRDDRGFLDHVRLHDGTIINPIGLTLAPGMIVSIDGFNAGPVFEANEIDTPYTYYGGVPYYLGHPWWYWGPSVSLGFFFGGGGGWWRGGWRGPGAGVYYHGGSFNGRHYVAPVSRGGYTPHGVGRAPSGHEGGGSHGH
jgi:hypothetical protein